MGNTLRVTSTLQANTEWETSSLWDDRPGPRTIQGGEADPEPPGLNRKQDRYPRFFAVLCRLVIATSLG